MRPKPWGIATALGVAAVAAAGAHYIALSCCSTRMSILGLLGYSLRDGYWIDWVSSGVLALSAVAMLLSLWVARFGSWHLRALSRSSDALMLAGLGIAVLLPIILWVFVFTPGVERYFGGVWTYETVQSPLVETLMDITIGSLAFALASWARLKMERWSRTAQ